MSSELLPGILTWLKGLVPTVEDLLPPIPPRLSNRFAQLFPNYNTFEGLKGELQGVLDQAAAVFGNDKTLTLEDQPPPHAPRHDLESIFWGPCCFSVAVSHLTALK
jgi:hypothetical protein